MDNSDLVNKKIYKKPKLILHGDLRTITLKINDGIDGDGMFQASLN
ncbi:hypothetical protein GCM10025861_04570 [Methanobacterium petrolearium]|nr:hypothetical protein GCM10025861_04570 [Methanobacterium petrolearium]